MAQLVEQLLPIPEVRGSRSVIGQPLYWTFTVNCVEKTKIKKRGLEWPTKKHYYLLLHYIPICGTKSNTIRASVPWRDLAVAFEQNERVSHERVSLQRRQHPLSCCCCWLLALSFGGLVSFPNWDYFLIFWCICVSIIKACHSCGSLSLL